MSDDLVRRLWKGIADTDAQQDAADRIEALTAALEKADALMLALNWYADQSAIMAKPTIDAQWASNRFRDDRGATARDALAAYSAAREAVK